MIGEPKVRKEIYINHILIRDVAIPIRSPIAEHTPKACHSMKFFSCFIKANLNFLFQVLEKAFGPVNFLCFQ